MTGIRRVRIDPTHSIPSANPIFVGSVSTQDLVNESDGDLLRVTAVTFKNGATNQPHWHTTDQVLIAIMGSGFLAADDEHLPLAAGDIAFIPKGTRHWHGANSGSTFTHLAILTPGHTKIDEQTPAE